MQTRLITPGEMRKVNDIIRSKFGLRYTIANGSVTEGNIYHIVFREYHEADNMKNAKAVGEIVKEHLNAAEVYNFGVRLA